MMKDLLWYSFDRMKRSMQRWSKACCGQSSTWNVGDALFRPSDLSVRSPVPSTSRPMNGHTYLPCCVLLSCCDVDGIGRPCKRRLLGIVSRLVHRVPFVQSKAGRIPVSCVNPRVQNKALCPAKVNDQTTHQPICFCPDAYTTGMNNWY